MFRSILDRGLLPRAKLLCSLNYNRAIVISVSAISLVPRAYSAFTLAVAIYTWGANSRAAGTEVRWRGCLVALDAIDPVAESAAPLEDVSAWSSKGSVDIVVDAAIGIPTGGAGVPEATGDVEVRKDDRTTAFLARQLRLLMERSSEQAGEGSTVGSSVFGGLVFDLICTS